LAASSLQTPNDFRFVSVSGSAPFATRANKLRRGVATDFLAKASETAAVQDMAVIEADSWWSASASVSAPMRELKSILSFPHLHVQVFAGTGAGSFDSRLDFFAGGRGGSQDHRNGN
jgi:hypothetical protein